MKNKSNDYYYCYSPIQKTYFVENGYMYLDNGVHFKTGRNFWVFKRTTKLDQLCKEYEENKRKIVG